MGKLQESEITKRLMPNKALFADIHVISKKFDILPDGNVHYGASIAYQDLQELREDFLVDLMDTIVDWIYSADKYAVLKEKETKKGNLRQRRMLLFNEGQEISFVKVPAILFWYKGNLENYYCFILYKNV